VRPAGGHDIGAEAQLGHEPPIHDVPLDAVDASGVQLGDLVSQSGVVGAQHGRDNRWSPHPLALARLASMASSMAW
jgi:hypothetical protein